MSDRRPETCSHQSCLFNPSSEFNGWAASLSGQAGGAHMVWGSLDLPDGLALTRPAGETRWAGDVGRDWGHCHAESGTAIWEWQWRGGGRGALGQPSVEWRGVQEDLVGSRKMRKVEVVAVLQLDTKPKGGSFWSSTACRQLLLKPLLAVGPAGRPSCRMVSAKEGLKPSLPLPAQAHGSSKIPLCLCKSSSNPALSSAVLAPAEIQEHRWAWKQQALWFYRMPESGLLGQDSQQCCLLP